MSSWSLSQSPETNEQGAEGVSHCTLWGEGGGGIKELLGREEWSGRRPGGCLALLHDRSIHGAQSCSCHPGIIFFKWKEEHKELV